MRVPGTKRTVRAPDGVRWRVGRRWTASWRVDIRRRRVRRGDASGDGSGGDAGVGVGDLLGGDDLLAGVALVLVVGIVLLLVFPLLEVVIAVALLAAAVFGRVVLRRPWTVEARQLRGVGRRSVKRAAWQVVGFRRSGAVAREIAERLAVDGRLPERPARTLPVAVPDAPPT